MPSGPEGTERQSRLSPTLGEQSPGPARQRAALGSCAMPCGAPVWPERPVVRRAGRQTASPADGGIQTKTKSRFSEVSAKETRLRWTVQQQGVRSGAQPLPVLAPQPPGACLLVPEAGKPTSEDSPRAQCSAGPRDHTWLSAPRRSFCLSGVPWMVGGLCPVSGAPGEGGVLRDALAVGTEPALWTHCCVQGTSPGH